MTTIFSLLFYDPPKHAQKIVTGG